MPFVLCHAHTFQATMNELLKSFLRKFVTVFFDDILVFSPTFDDHLKHLACVFDSLIEGQIFLKESKCSFAQQQLEYLGHIISAKGVAPNLANIKEMVEWPVPTTTNSLGGFLGLTRFYQKFIKGYASIATPLTNLLQKDNFH